MAKASALPAIVRVEVGYVAYDTGDPRGKPDPAEERVMAERLIVAAARAVLGDGVLVVHRPQTARSGDFAK
jgi:hypothetical protein